MNVLSSCYTAKVSCNPILWLEKNAIGFNCLSAEERASLMYFPLLWSHFEAVVLGNNGSVNKIKTCVYDLHSRGKLDAASFTVALKYFQARYYSSGQFTDPFNYLMLRKNDRPAFVRDVLSGTNPNPVDGVVALFIVIYRFRNNYFHGSKWVYELKGQLDNFNYANDSIMAFIDMWQS